MNKTHHLKRNSLIIALALAALVWGAIVPGTVSGAAKAAPAPAEKSQDTGRLVIVRAANLGATIVGVAIDGVQRAKITFNGRYDAPLAVGPHVVTVTPIPNREYGKPFDTHITVEKGKTYTFTAKRSDVSLILK